MIKKDIDNTIKIEKSKLRLYALIGSLLPVVLLAITLSFTYFNNLKKIYTDDLNKLEKAIIEEKKIFLRNAVEQTIFHIEHIRADVAKENRSKSLSQKELDAISIERIADYVRDLRFTKEKYYIWINRIVDYSGGDDYAIRLVHPNLPETEGTFLSTNMKDIKGNKPYRVELDGIKKEGELYFQYYFKKLNSDKIARKLSFAKLYKPFNWVIATGMYLDDVDEYILKQKQKMQENYDKQMELAVISSSIFILLTIIIAGYYQYNMRKLVLSYEGRISDYTDELEKLAVLDQLTGLYNRLELDNIYLKELEKAARYDHDFSIIMIDLDHFKNINDTYGHQAGDCVLRELSHILQSSIRSVDIAGRWGGEEFLIICSETNLDGAFKLAEYIRQSVESHDFKAFGKITGSFGVSSYHKNDTQESMTERADNALYRAKDAGRNCVRAEI